MTPKSLTPLHSHSTANTRSFFVLMLLVLIISYLLLSPYLSIIFLGFMTAWAFKPIYLWLHRHLFKHTGLAVTISILLLYLTILLPLGFMVNAAIGQTIILSRDINNLVAGRLISFDALVDQTNLFISQLPAIDYQISKSDVLTLMEDVARPVGNFLFDKAIGFTSSAPDLIARTILFTFIVISLLPHSDRFITHLKRLSPLDDHLNDLYIRRILAMTTSMIKGTFIIAIVQAAAATLVLWLVGVNYLFILFLIMTFLGIIPSAGTSTVMLPVGLFFLATGNIPSGLFVLLTTIIVISNLDNILRPMLVSKEAMLNPALIILGVFGGINMFGVLGAIYGPVIIIILITTLEIYTNYYSIKPKS